MLFLCRLRIFASLRRSPLRACPKLVLLHALSKTVEPSFEPAFSCALRLLFFCPFADRSFVFCLLFDRLFSLCSSFVDFAFLLVLDGVPFEPALNSSCCMRSPRRSNRLLN